MNDDIAETTTSSPMAASASSATPLTRRHLIGGAVAGAAGLTLLTGGFVAAQASTSNAATSTTERASGESVKALIAAVQKDRDAVASSIDSTLVNQLLSLATDLEAQSETTTTTSSAATATPGATAKGDTVGKLHLLGAAALVARAARADIVAQLTTYSLPSGQVKVSQMLAKTHDAIGTDGPAITGKNIIDASSAVTFSQRLYSLAYDAYGKALYARADAYGEAAEMLLAAGAVLTGDLKDLAGIGGERLLGHLKKRRQHEKNGSNGNDSTTPAAPATPVPVPSPSF